MPHLFFNKKHWLLIALLFLPMSAFAFPTPDLVIGLFGSSAQLIGIFSAGLGLNWLRVKRKLQHPPSKTNAVFVIFLGSLLFISLCLNIGQYLSHTSEKARRLQTNILRPSPPTYTIQKQLGMSRTEFQTWMDRRENYQIIDVREPEEFASGHLPGAKHSRYADLFGINKNLLSKDVNNVLVCDSGFRSGEICSKLTADGLPCRFLDGGYNKWVAENRPMESMQSKVASGLQLLPRYKNDQVLLETEDVDKLIKEQKAQFIDVRPAEEFALNHLPDAINIPVREAPSAALNQALKALPHVPIIAACYENRSCFYGKVIGLRLTNQGADFRGRYTLTQEYPIPSRLLKSPLQRSLQNAAEKLWHYLGVAPRWILQNCIGVSMGLAIVMLAIFSRILALPFSLYQKNIRQGQLKLRSEYTHLQAAYGADTVGLQQAWLRTLKQAGVRPLLSVLMSLFPLLITAACLIAVHEISQQYAGTDHPYNAWTKASFYSLFPLLSGLALGFYCAVLLRQKTWWRWPVIIGTSVFLAWQLNNLSEADNLYILISLLCVLLQQNFESLLPYLSSRNKNIALKLQFVRSLFHNEESAENGQKAQALSRMLIAGLPVPKGLLIDASAWMSNDLQIKTKVRNELWLALHDTRMDNIERFAVRSSAVDEDTSRQSHAGQYLTRLDVSRNDLPAAIEQVCLSYRHPTCTATIPDATDTLKTAGAVIIQGMLEPDYTGVLFTEHPQHSAYMLVEVAGGKAAVVTGEERPLAIRIGRATGDLPDEVKTAIPLHALWKLAKQIEHLEGTAQDIEWACVAGQFHILQARPVTRRITDGDSAHALFEQERARLLHLLETTAQHASTPCFVQDDVTALLPHASAASLSLLRAIQQSGGTVELAWRKLGLKFDESLMPHWLTVFGHTRRLQGIKTKQSALGLLSQFFLARKADMLAENFLQNFLPEFQQRMRLRTALDFSRLHTAELVQLLVCWHDEFIKEIYVEAEVMTTVASLYVQSAKNALEKRGLSATIYLRPDQIVPDLRALQMRIAVRNELTTVAEYLAEFGHRAVHDFELSEPRAHEQSANLLRQISQLPESLPAIVPAQILPAGMLAKTVSRARGFLYLKEQAKHECLRALDQIRRLMLELDQRWQMKGAIFDLSFAAIFKFSTPLTNTQREELRLKKLQKQVFQKVKLDPVMSITSLEQMDFRSAEKSVSSHKIGMHLSGIRVAGSGEVIGRALVLHHPTGQVQLLPGQLLVLANANPAWIPLFPTAAGVICETGGWLCHAAIMAREFDLPAIFSASGAMSSIKTGDELILHEDGRVIINVS